MMKDAPKKKAEEGPQEGRSQKQEKQSSENAVFPKEFLFGAATASYQIEGHPLADGAAPSIWHEFAHKPWKIQGGDNGDVACDHYQRYPDDVRHMAELGLQAYRFSLAWPRIVPEPGKVNQKGLDFYSSLVDELLKKGIIPMATLFHWDAPLWLEKQGGFASPESVEHFRFYADTVMSHLGDRVKRWITLNEPMVFTTYGYGTGHMAPGYRFQFSKMFKAVHYLLLSHAEGVRVCRERVKDGEVGIAQAQPWIRPYREWKGLDGKAAGVMDAFLNRMYMDPIFFGGYPEEVLSRFGRFFPKGMEKDLERIHEPVDFVGINYYMQMRYAFCFLYPFLQAVEKRDKQGKYSAMWEIYPQGLYNLLLRLRDEYGNPPCYITENGFPLPENKGEPIYEDTERIEYLQDHIYQVWKVKEEGVDCRGYFLWSLMDNFEWALGNRMRFGIIRTDFDTLDREWKKSAYWYRDLIASRRLSTP